MLIKVQRTFLLSWDWTEESTEVEERCCTDQVKYDILQQSTASSTNVQDWELACKLCSVQILRVHLYHYPICIITFLKQALKQCRHCFQINVAISKHISFLANSTLILLEVCLCGSTPKREQKTGKWKREDRDKRENAVACVTKYGEREQLGGHDNYGLI